MRMAISLCKAFSDLIQIQNGIVRVGPFLCKTLTWAEVFSVYTVVNRIEISNTWLNSQKVTTI